MKRSLLVTCGAISCLACSHTDAFNVVAPELGPATAGSDVRLTLNPVNYWPTLTEDGSSILYAFIDESEPTVRPLTQFEPFPLHIHRCMGVMPITGGTRRWQYCDNRPEEIDSLNSFTAFAMDTGGRLLYAEAVGSRVFTFDDPRSTLWLADSATPFRRQRLLQLPLAGQDSAVNWLADLRWTGASSFLALGQRLAFVSHCDQCTAVDSSFYQLGILRGTITAGTATVSVIPGTVGATGYAVVGGGASVIFARLGSPDLFEASLSAGTPTTIASNVAAAGEEILGLSCRATDCMIATGPVPGPGVYRLRRVSLSPGAGATVVYTSGTILSMPLLTTNGNVIVQVGPEFGRLRTFQGADVALHLLTSLAP